MKTIQFQFSTPMSAAKTHNSRPTFFGDLIISGSGIEDKSNNDEPYRADIESILFNGHEVKEIFEYLFHATLDGADVVENAALAHVIGLFGEDPAQFMDKPKPATLRGATDIFKSLQVFDPNMQLPKSLRA